MATQMLRWTDAELESVRVQRRRGVLWTSIVLPPGRTFAAMVAKFSQIQRATGPLLVTNRWSAEKIELLLQLRGVQKLKWREIAEQLGDTKANCCNRYNYYSHKRRVAAAARRPAISVPVIAKPPAIVPVPAIKRVPAIAPVLAIKPVPAAEIVRRPRYFSELDGYVAARIARQGVTAGLLGDPLPGRSALDKRRGSS